MSALEQIDALPFALRWIGAPQSSSIVGAGLTVTAGARTDWFIDPNGNEQSDNAPALVGEPAGDFVLSARVEVDFAETFDAGVLALWGDARRWAKLCFEYSPQGEAMVVSVVTRGVSDDCNSTVVAGGAVWLRVARLGQALAFHASSDGDRWQLVRYFTLGAGPLSVGFEAQSPRGGGCSARFSDIRFAYATLTELRDGS